MNWHRLVVLYNMKREQESTKTRVYTTLSLCRKLCECVAKKFRRFDLVYSRVDFLRVYPRSVRANWDMYPTWEGIVRTSADGGEVYKACQRIKTLHDIIMFCAIISCLHYLPSSILRARFWAMWIFIEVSTYVYCFSYVFQLERPRGLVDRSHNIIYIYT